MPLLRMMPLGGQDANKLLILAEPLAKSVVDKFRV